MLIQGVLWMLRQANLQGTPSAISLQVLESGATHYVNQDGLIVDLFGQVVAHANHLVLQVPVKASAMSATCGQSGLNLSSSADLTLFLANKLKAQLSTDGSTLFKMTWKEKTTSLGLRVSLLRGSVRRISDTDCTSWRSPQKSDGEGGVMEIRPGTAGKYKLRDEVHLASWPTPNSTVIEAKSKPPIMSHRKPTDPQIGLADVAVHLASWPTPLRADGRGSAGAAKHKNSELPNAVRLVSGDPPIGSTAKTEKPAQLNPAHSRWLMGLPPEWDVCAPTATPSSRKSRKPL
jgi:hypothetical protein